MICTNHYANTIRKKAAIFKFALEQRDYNFVVNVLVKGRCSRDSKTRLKRLYEEVNGKQEDMLDFIEYVQNDEIWGGHYRTPTVDHIKGYLTRCLKEDSEYFKE